MIYYGTNDPTIVPTYGVSYNDLYVQSVGISVNFPVTKTFVKGSTTGSDTNWQLISTETSLVPIIESQRDVTGYLISAMGFGGNPGNKIVHFQSAISTSGMHVYQTIGNSTIKFGSNVAPYSNNRFNVIGSTDNGDVVEIITPGIYSLALTLGWWNYMDDDDGIPDANVLISFGISLNATPASLTAGIDVMPGGSGDNICDICFFNLNSNTNSTTKKITTTRFFDAGSLLRAHFGSNVPASGSLTAGLYSRLEISKLTY